MSIAWWLIKKYIIYFWVIFLEAGKWRLFLLMLKVAYNEKPEGGGRVRKMDSVRKWYRYQIREIEFYFFCHRLFFVVLLFPLDTTILIGDFVSIGDLHWRVGVLFYFWIREGDGKKCIFLNGYKVCTVCTLYSRDSAWGRRRCIWRWLETG